MFTGIVEELGTIVARDDLTDSARITVDGPWSPPTPVTAIPSRSTACV